MNKAPVLITLDPKNGLNHFVARMRVPELGPRFKSFATFWNNAGDMDNYIIFYAWQMNPGKLAVDIIYYTPYHQKVIASNMYEYVLPMKHYPKTLTPSKGPVDIELVVCVDYQMMKMFVGFDASHLFNNVEIDYGLQGDWCPKPADVIQLFNDTWQLVGLGVIVDKRVGRFSDIDNFVFRNSVHKLYTAPKNGAWNPPASIPFELLGTSMTDYRTTCCLKRNCTQKDSAYTCKRPSLRHHGFLDDAIDVERASQQLTPWEVYNGRHAVYEHSGQDPFERYPGVSGENFSSKPAPKVNMKLAVFVLILLLVGVVICFLVTGDDHQDKDAVRLSNGIVRQH